MIKAITGRTKMDESIRELIMLFFDVPTDRLKPIYDRHGIEPSNAGDLVNEICLDGSNTIASLLRGWGPVSYLEVVQDVAEISVATGNRQMVVGHVSQTQVPPIVLRSNQVFAGDGALVDEIRFLPILAGKGDVVGQEDDDTAFKGRPAFAGKAEEAGVDGIAVAQAGRDDNGPLQ